MLHGFGLIILLSICDGASENRAFISMNGTNQFKRQAFNRFSRRPIYFFSDPPHLVKKLRNNFYNSGFKDNSPQITRTLKLNKQYVLCDHIYSVYQREKRRRLYATPLRKAHVELDNLSKMRVKLAVNNLQQKVADEMKAHENNVTESTQQYIAMCHNVWQVFDDRRPISSVRDPRIDTLDTVLSFFCDRKASLVSEFKNQSHTSSHFITWRTMFDIQVQCFEYL